MKKLITILFAFMVTSQGLMATEPISTSNPPNRGFEFKIDFHTSRSQCTKYLGICKISFCVTVNFEEGALGSGEVPCNITINRNNELIIQLSESSISKYDPALLKYFAGKTSVTFDETYDITEEISKGFQPQGNVIIRPGTYQLAYENGMYTLIIPL
ncbi:MAG: hypothetical protein HQ542_06495 [Bacteroidia bacterium]|nr:hypothetical protein [Bacteroidia bacterium]